MSPIATVCNRHRLIIPAGECCPTCASEQNAKQTARRSDRNIELGRNSQHWRRISRARRQLASGLCELGYEGCSGRATTVDLIGGGDHSRAALEDTRAACLQCHGAQDGGRR